VAASSSAGPNTTSCSSSSEIRSRASAARSGSAATGPSGKPSRHAARSSPRGTTEATSNRAGRLWPSSSPSGWQPSSNHPAEHSVQLQPEPTAACAPDARVGAVASGRCRHAQQPVRPVADGWEAVDRVRRQRPVGQKRPQCPHDCPQGIPRRGLVCRITRNPADAADPPRASATARPTMSTWTTEELWAFLDYTADHRLHAAFVTLATAARPPAHLGRLWRWRPACIPRSSRSGWGTPTCRSPSTSTATSPRACTAPPLIGSPASSSAPAETLGEVMVSKRLAKRSARAPDPLVYKGKAVPERGVEPLCPFGQTGLSRPRIPFRHPGPSDDQLTGDAAAGPEHSATAVAPASLSVHPPRPRHLTRVSP
jgi:hypothetical protein